MSEDCKCGDCQSACQTKPGWFMPGEAEKLADFFGVSFEEVFKTYLGIDWWEADHNFENDVFVLSPAILEGTPGEEFPANPHGTCVFFKNGECSIHEVKPFECRSLLHDSHEAVAERHIGVARAWNETQHQNQIQNLLGREPTAEEYAPYGSIFGSLFN